jgi:hypothetical protein
MRKTYTLAVSPLVTIVPLVVLGIVSVAVPVAVALAGPKGPPPVILVLVGPILAWNWWVLLRTVYRVERHEDGALDWIALARTVTVRPEQVLRIAPDRMGQIGFLRLTHTEGSLRFVNQLTGFHEILAAIRERNPRVELVGC